MAEDKRETIYKVDSSFYRYQDALMWSRFQMAATIEAALLYAVYGGLSIPSASEKALFVVALSLVVLIVCRIAWRDGVLGTSHLKRIKEFEGGIAKFELPPWKGPTGLQLMLAVMWLINLGNAEIALRAIWAALSPAWT